MKTDIYNQCTFNNDIPRSFGLIKVNAINYHKIKSFERSDVIYHDATGTLLFGDNVVMIDDSLADDIALYRKDFLPHEPPKEVTRLYYEPHTQLPDIPIPPILPIMPIVMPIA